MLGIVTALHCEAQPIIKHFGLKKDMASKGQARFLGEGLCLIESGLGQLKSAVACTRLLSIPDTNYFGLINIGCCGSRRNDHIGAPYLIHKITQQASGKSYYPDILIKTNLNEATLCTVDRPVLNARMGPSEAHLVDMEAAGFFEAASQFLAPSKIVCLKVVSDLCDGKFPSTQEVTKIIEAQIPRLEVIIQQLAALADTTNRLLSCEDQNILKALAERHRLTASQHRQLEEAAIRWVLRGSTLLQLTSRFPESTAQSTKLRDQSFKSFLATL